MTPQQELHLEYILGMAKSLISTKYRAGAAEHGGDLSDKSASELVDDIIYEAVDGLVYALTLKQKLIDIKRNLHDQPSVDAGRPDGRHISHDAVRAPSFQVRTVRNI